jgi:hypothetical protein
MSENSPNSVQPRKERSPTIMRAAERLIEALESATPDERAQMITDNRQQLSTLSLMLDGLVHRGELPGRTANHHE